MNRLYFTIATLTIFTLRLTAQDDPTKLLRKGNNEYHDNKFHDAEILYRKANEVKPDKKAAFNLGNSLYKQKKYNEAVEQFDQANTLSASKNDIAKSYYNLGNSLFMDKKYEESIKAYQQSLLNNPKDMETKHNLSFAQRMLREQQQQQQKQDKDQNNQDKKEQEKDKKENNKDSEDKQKDEKGKPSEDQEKAQEKQGNAKQISKEDADRILQALENKEKDIQEALKREKAKKDRVKTDIDW